MTDKVKWLLEQLQSLAMETNCHTITVSGAPGAGKTQLARAISQEPGLGALHVPLDYWIKQSTQERAMAWRKAKDSGDKTMMKYLARQENIFDWDKFHTDFITLRKTGELELKNIYDQASGELTGRATLYVPPKPPHLIVLEGCALMEDKIIEAATLSILLELSVDAVESRRHERDRFKKTPEQMQENNLRLREWAEVYFNQPNRLRVEVLSEKDEDAFHRILRSCPRLLRPLPTPL